MTAFRGWRGRRSVDVDGSDQDRPLAKLSVRCVRDRLGNHRAAARLQAHDDGRAELEKVFVRLVTARESPIRPGSQTETPVPATGLSLMAARWQCACSPCRCRELPSLPEGEWRRREAADGGLLAQHSVLSALREPHPVALRAPTLPFGEGWDRVCGSSDYCS